MTDLRLSRARIDRVQVVIHSATLPRPPTGRRGAPRGHCAHFARFPQLVPQLWI